MTHARATDEQRERAALYALGALDATEAHAFEAHLARGCRACQAEVDGYGAVAGSLALAAPPVPPAADLRTRVLAAAARKPLPLMHFVGPSDEGWQEIQPGVSRRDLADDPASPAYLIRVAPGASIAEHRHSTIEHCYVLSGDITVVGRELGPGDYHRAARGTTHGQIRSEKGCTFLVVHTPV